MVNIQNHNISFSKFKVVDRRRELEKANDLLKSSLKGLSLFYCFEKIHRQQQGISGGKPCYLTVPEPEEVTVLHEEVLEEVNAEVIYE